VLVSSLHRDVQIFSRLWNCCHMYQDETPLHSGLWAHCKMVQKVQEACVDHFPAVMMSVTHQALAI
jgi:hypothetical protein